MTAPTRASAPACRALRDRTYASPLPCGLVVESCAAETYWELHEAELRATFPPEVYLGVGQVHAQNELADYLLLRAGERVAGMTSGFASLDRPDTYRSLHSALHPDYRGQGVYAELQRRLIAYTGAAGFRVVESEHAPSNNAAIVPKLRAGFRIVGLEIEAAWGPVVRLRYFHDRDEEAAYLYRNGLATLTPALIRAGFGGMAELRAQFRAADSDDG